MLFRSPSNNQNLVSVSYYDSANNSIAINSSRGFTRDGKIKPDFAAPGIGIYGPLPRIGNIYPATEEERKRTARYDYKSGSSMAAAITSGISAMLMEWGALRGNDITMDTVSIQKYLIRGSNGIEEPNRLWGDYVIIVSYIIMPGAKGILPLADAAKTVYILPLQEFYIIHGFLHGGVL